jgi:hypothetical protein
MASLKKLKKREIALSRELIAHSTAGASLSYSTLSQSEVRLGQDTARSPGKKQEKTP